MANWYIDRDATGANNGTTWTDAWQTFAAMVWTATGIIPGDYVYISGGSTGKIYSTSHADGDSGKFYLLTVQSSGVSTAPITIAASTDSGHDGPVIFDCNTTQEYAIGIKSGYGTGHYINIDGTTNKKFEFRNCGSAGLVIQNAGNINVQGITMTSALSNGILLYAIHDVDIGYFDFSCATTSIIDQGDAVFASGSTGNSSQIEIHHCNFENNCQTTDMHYDYLQAGSVTDVSIHHCYGKAKSSCDPGTQGVYFTKCHGTLEVYNNAFVNPEGKQILYLLTTQTTGGKLVAMNNVLVGGGGNTGVVNITDSTAAAAVDHIFKNNVVKWNGDSNTTGRCVALYNFAGDPTNFDYNCYINEVTTDVFRAYGNLYSFATWQTTGFDPNGMYADPLFRSQSSNTFNVMPTMGSPTRDAGETLTSITTDDLLGKSRPLGTAWDIGAYEFNAGLSGCNPSIPTPVRGIRWR